MPLDLHTCFRKERVTMLLRTRPFNKADKSPEALSGRLGRYWDGLRPDVIGLANHECG